MSNTAIVAYVPVLHQGYVRFFKSHPEAQTLVLVKRDQLTELVPSLTKDIRALPVEEMKKAIEALDIFSEVRVVDNVSDLQNFSQLILPSDEAMVAYAEKYLQGKAIQYDTVFLRWDSQRSLSKKHVEPDTEVTEEQLRVQLMNQAVALSDKSADWWRQVAGMIVKDGEVVLAAVNKHLPHEQQPYYDGDPRANFHKGEYIEISTAIHAEQQLIAEAAKRGISLAGAAMYVTTFPCPVCAKSVAYCGVKTVYYKEGYSMVDGAELMRANGIKLIKVLT